MSRYQEIICESSVKTHAATVHFHGGGYDHYFAHTRIEDMGDSYTRRVIEIQSDLFQKQGLKRELPSKILPGAARRRAKRFAELRLLLPYRHTRYQRIIQAEIRRAARAEKDRLQFPTGETAMKIEGLGESASFFNLSAEAIGSPDNIQAGHELRADRDMEFGAGGNWIVTGMLRDGRFTAVPKHFVAEAISIFPSEPPQEAVIEMLKNGTLRDQQYVTETFDISGTIDTANPIYRFYETQIHRCLKRLRPDMGRVTDPQGVEWFEITLTPDDTTRPVLAFGT